MTNTDMQYKIKLIIAYMATKIIGFLSYFHIFCSKIAYLQGILYYPSPKAEETPGNLGCRPVPYPFHGKKPNTKTLRLVLGKPSSLVSQALYLTDLSLPSIT